MQKPGDPAKANPPTPAPNVEQAVDMAVLFAVPAPAAPAATIATATAPELMDMAALFGAPAAPTLQLEMFASSEPVVAAPWQPITATFPFDVDPLPERVGWYEFVPRMTAQRSIMRYWWNGEDWQTSPEGSPGDMRYDGFIGWRGMLAQCE